MTALNSTPTESDERAPRQRRPAVRWKLLLAAAGLVPLITYFGVAGVIAAVTVTADGGRASLGAALAAALPGWLATFQVPLSIQRAPLSALPLLPTLAVVTLIAKASAHVVRRSRARRPEQGLWVVLTMAFAHAAIGTVLALALTRLPGPVSVTPGDAFARCGLLAAVGASLGVVHRCGLLYLLWDRVPGALWWGLNCGVRTAIAIAGTGALVLVGAACLSLPELMTRSSQADSAGAVFGGVVLSLLYLPDAVLAAWSYVTGAGVSFGEFAFGSLGAAPQVQILPTVPLFGLLPDAGLSAWWSLLVALPAAVGVFLGWSCRDAHESPGRRVLVTVTASAVAAAAVLAAGAAVGGRAGGGGLDPVSLHPALLTVATWGWLVLPAGVTAWFAGPRGVHGAADGVADEVVGPTAEEAAAEDGDGVDDGALDAADEPEIAADTIDDDLAPLEAQDGAGEDGADREGEPEDRAKEAEPAEDD